MSAIPKNPVSGIWNPTIHSTRQKPSVCYSDAYSFWMSFECWTKSPVFVCHLRSTYVMWIEHQTKIWDSGHLVTARNLIASSIQVPSVWVLFLFHLNFFPVFFSTVVNLKNLLTNFRSPLLTTPTLSWQSPPTTWSASGRGPPGMGMTPVRLLRAAKTKYIKYRLWTLKTK